MACEVCGAPLQADQRLCAACQVAGGVRPPEAPRDSRATLLAGGETWEAVQEKMTSGLPPPGIAPQNLRPLGRPVERVDYWSWDGAGRRWLLGLMTGLILLLGAMAWTLRPRHVSVRPPARQSQALPVAPKQTASAPLILDVDQMAKLLPTPKKPSAPLKAKVMVSEVGFTRRHLARAARIQRARAEDDSPALEWIFIVYAASQDPEPEYTPDEEQVVSFNHPSRPQEPESN